MSSPDLSKNEPTLSALIDQQRITPTLARLLTDHLIEGRDLLLLGDPQGCGDFALALLEQHPEATVVLSPEPEQLLACSRDGLSCIISQVASSVEQGLLRLVLGLESAGIEHGQAARVVAASVDIAVSLSIGDNATVVQIDRVRPEHHSGYLLQNIYTLHVEKALPVESQPPAKSMDSFAIPTPENDRVETDLDVETEMVVPGWELDFPENSAALPEAPPMHAAGSEIDNDDAMALSDRALISATYGLAPPPRPVSTDEHSGHAKGAVKPARRRS